MLFDRYQGLSRIFLVILYKIFEGINKDIYVRNIIFFEEKIFFLKFRYKEKSKSSSKYFKKLKNSSIEELIESMNISDKYKKFEKDKNRSSLKELSKNDWFVKLFKLKYLDLFSSYYNNEQPLKKLSFFGKTISFSETTKSFYDLLVKNEKSKEDIINAAKIFFFDDKGYFESD